MKIDWIMRDLWDTGAPKEGNGFVTKPKNQIYKRRPTGNNGNLRKIDPVMGREIP